MNLVCYTCGKKFDINSPRWRCDCGGYLNVGGYEKIDFLKLKGRTPNLWHYKELLPVFKDENVVSYGEGFTPLVKHNVFGKEVLFKLEFLFSSGSYKDRGSTVLISKVKELGIKEIIEDSSGNAGSSIEKNRIIHIIMHCNRTAKSCGVA